MFPKHPKNLFLKPFFKLSFFVGGEFGKKSFLAFLVSGKAIIFKKRFLMGDLAGLKGGE